ncbi:MAG: hypothetical protein AABX49_01870, partial [Nanoarchaeota archaeon]
MRKRKKEVKKEVNIQIALVISIIALMILMYYFVPPTIIGFSVLEGYTWSIENSSNFGYNSEEIEINNSVIKLKSN